MKITLKGREHEVESALPLTWGDYRKMKREHGVAREELRTGSDEAIFGLLVVILQKLDPSVTPEDAEALPLEKGFEVVNVISEAARKQIVDRPTSEASTSAP